MSKHSHTINLKILDKDYVVSCPEHESDDLLACADYLSEKMHATKEQGKTVSTERLLVMTALNIVHEFLQHKAEKKDYTDNTVIERLEQKIELALKE